MWREHAVVNTARDKYNSTEMFELACVEDIFLWTSSREHKQGIASQMTDLCYCTFYDFSSLRHANLQERGEVNAGRKFTFRVSC